MPLPEFEQTRYELGNEKGKKLLEDSQPRHVSTKRIENKGGNMGSIVHIKGIFMYIEQNICQSL
jgi:hypothetical protein